MNAAEAKKFITISYNILLERDPTEEELTSLSDKAVKDKQSENDIIYDIVSSEEFKKLREPEEEPAIEEETTPEPEVVAPTNKRLTILEYILKILWKGWNVKDD